MKLLIILFSFILTSIILFIIYVLLKAREATLHDPYQISILVIKRNFSECQTILQKRGIYTFKKISEKEANFYFKSDKTNYEATVFYNGNNCAQIYLLATDMINPEFNLSKAKSNPLFSKVWQRVDRKNYRECYKRRIGPEINKKYRINIIQFFGLNQEGKMFVEAIEGLE